MIGIMSPGSKVFPWAFVFALGVSPVMAAPANPDCALSRIMSVDDGHLEFHSDRIVVIAQGTTATAGWTNAQLRPLGRSADGGTASFEFVACAPRDFVAQVLSKISAQGAVSATVKGLREIVIKAATNSQTNTVIGF